jgi:hypothetical protein
VITLAAVPDTPTDQVVSDATITSESVIKVTYGPLDASEDGGAPVLSYELQMDDGIGGDFASLVGAELESLATEYEIGHGITPGGLYRFRYRAINVNGASGWSEISYIRAA